MFKSERQRCQAIMTLWQGAPFEGSWTLDGPSDQALKWLRRRPGWSASEVALFKLGWALWNDSATKLNFVEVWRFDATRLRKLGELLTAMSTVHVDRGEAVDAWLERWAAWP